MYYNKPSTSHSVVTFGRSLAMGSKTVLLKYQEHRKKVVIPAEKETSDLAFLELSFRQFINFEKQVNLRYRSSDLIVILMD